MQLGITHGKGREADRITISIGVTTRKVGIEHTGEDFVRRSGGLLYLSKRDGKNNNTFGKF